MNKDILKICHDNTHSTSRIFRNIMLLKKDIENNNWSGVENRLDAIEKAAMECREQVDNLYLIFKENK